MKKIKAFSLVFVVLALLVSLSACGKDDSKALVGTWKADLDATQIIDEQLSSLGMEDLALESRCVITLVLEFDAEQHYTVRADAAATMASVSAYMEELIPAVTEQMYKTAEASGLDRSTFDSAFEERYNCTPEEYLQQQFDAQDLASTLTAGTTEGKYRAVKGKLYTVEEDHDAFDEEEYDLYTLDGDTLTFTAIDSSFSGLDEDMVKSLLPIVFTRQ